MPLEKMQLDTIHAYLRTIVSEDKTSELMGEIQELDSESAQKLIVLFEQRSNMKVTEVQKFLKKNKSAA